jgi:hypothetical protein
MNQDQVIGNLLGLAAVITALPETQQVRADRLGKLIEEFLQIYPESAEVEAAARRMSSLMLAMSRTAGM